LVYQKAVWAWDELVRGARQVIQQAIEAELQALLERFENVKTVDVHAELTHLSL
jgi:hypothetical protein